MTTKNQNQMPAATEGCAAAAGYVAGQRVKWWHYDRRGTKDFSGIIVGQSMRLPGYRVRRDDTHRIVDVRTVNLRPHTVAGEATASKKGTKP